MKNGVYFISGIDTDIGKSYATGALATRLLRQGVNVMTQKMIQTGNSGISEDIELHRRMMGTPLSQDDRDGLTCPIVLSYPASPHLAAKIDRRPVDPSVIERATEELAKKHDIVLLEGAGGLMVPLTEELLSIDYVAQRGYPTILVTSGRLGSINHTLLSIEALKSRGMSLHSVIYNRYGESDKTISDETLDYLKKYLATHYPDAIVEELGTAELS